MRKVAQYIPLGKGAGAKGAKLTRALDRFRQYRVLRRARYPWNAAIHELRWMMHDADYIDEWANRRLGLGEHSWLFIAGCNNSGTTLLRKVLESHPLIRSLPREGQILTHALPRPTELGAARTFGRLAHALHWTEESDPAPAIRAKYDWARYFPRGPGHLLEKSPANTLRTRWLQRWFEPSRFVAIFRSPYPVCEGTRRRSGHSIEEAAAHWEQVNRRLLEDMAHLKQCMAITYEAFCERPEEHLEQLRSFLSLETPFDPSVLKSQKVHNIDSKAAPVQNFNAKSIERLSRTDIDTINRVARPMMERLGYEAI